MEVTYGYKKNYIDVYSDSQNGLGFLSRSKAGIIQYDSDVGQYVFYFSCWSKGFREETIKEINKKMKELRKIRDGRTKKC